MRNLSNQRKSSALSGPGSELVSTIGSIDLLNDGDRAALAENGISSLDALADLASDELLDIIGTANMSRETADQVIMAARAHWYE